MGVSCPVLDEWMKKTQKQIQQVPVYPVIRWVQKAYRHEIKENNALAYILSNFIFRADFRKLVFSNKNSWIWQTQFVSPFLVLGKPILFVYQILNSFLLQQCYIKCYNNKKPFVLHYFQYTCLSEALPWAPLLVIRHCGFLQSVLGKP